MIGQFKARRRERERRKADPCEYSCLVKCSASGTRELLATKVPPVKPQS